MKRTPIGPRPPDSPFLDQTEAAAFVRLAVGTLENYRTKGVGPAYLKLGRRIVYEMKDLIAWARATRRQSTTESPEDRGAAAPH